MPLTLHCNILMVPPIRMALGCLVDLTNRYRSHLLLIKDGNEISNCGLEMGELRMHVPLPLGSVDAAKEVKE